MSENSFGALSTLEVGGREHRIYRLDALADRFDVAHLPYALKILLENLLRCEGRGTVTAADVEALAGWSPAASPAREITFTPARVLMQDFTGVPAVVDLAAMREAMAALGGDPGRINPLVPVELVIDHSVQVDAFGSPAAFQINAEREFERNRERYAFLRFAQDAFDNFAVVPPDTGICHQVNLEYLGRVVFGSLEGPDGQEAYPDTLVGTDSHTTMINGLGVLGWGVGGIEAEAAMLGQPIPMLIPQVIGVRLHGRLRAGATATDLVLTVTERLRERGVVGKFVEFFGAGLAGLPIADRATIGNMSPEFGCTCAIFPVDAETLRYLELTGRPRARVELVDAYCREQGLFHEEGSPDPRYSEVLELDLGTVSPSLAGPKRPQDRIALDDSKEAFQRALAAILGSAGAGAQGGSSELHGHDEAVAESYPASDPPANGAPGHEPVAEGEAEEGSNGAPPATLAPARAAQLELDGDRVELKDGSVVIAAITSCTNTSNPSVMVAAGLLARNAVARGLARKPWVKTSLAPGSRVVTDYLQRAGLIEPLEALGFNLVGYGCTTCIGNSGPLPEPISEAVAERDLAVVSVLSGNRNFEGRINPDVRMNYLASPPLCVAYAIAGTMDIDIAREPLGVDSEGTEVHLRDIWPSEQEVAQTVAEALQADMFRKDYADLYAGDERWRELARELEQRAPAAEQGGGAPRFAWEGSSTYVRRPPFFDAIEPEPAPLTDIASARVLALLGDSVTTDHISPAGAIKRDSPAGRYLIEHGVSVRDFNSYGSRRGNHEVMMRGTFANVRLRNLIGGGDPLPEGGYTRHFGAGGPEQMTIYDAAMAYASEGVPLVVIAGSEYGSGSSRDWAAKGTRLLGVRAVIARSFERIHRSNLIGMGVLPLQLPEGADAQGLGITGEEEISISGIPAAVARAGSDLQHVHVRALRPDQDGRQVIELDALVRIDTPREAEYFRHGGILQYVLRSLR
ncbi:MAG TPA: aconitate hydratase [Solirubrobacteraceae bacterium]|nr:aconitate hydratase [Solirubrobacteraceae bacterium]